MRANGHHIGRHGNATCRHVDNGAIVAYALAFPGAEVFMRKKALDNLKFAVLSHRILSTSCCPTTKPILAQKTKKARPKEKLSLSKPHLLRCAVFDSLSLKPRVQRDAVRLRPCQARR